MVKIKFQDDSIAMVKGFSVTGNFGMAVGLASVYRRKNETHYQGDVSTMVAHEILDMIDGTEIIENDWEPEAEPKDRIY